MEREEKREMLRDNMERKEDGWRKEPRPHKMEREESEKISSLKREQRPGNVEQKWEEAEKS